MNNLVIILILLTHILFMPLAKIVGYDLANKIILQNVAKIIITLEVILQKEYQEYLVVA